MKGRVLVIDDEAEIRRNLTFGLTQEDYSVVTCPDGISAIHELNQSRNKGLAYDYLITDIFMPDIDGLKILKVIKNQYPDLPVLVITGFGDERLMMTALAEYNTGFLNKPFEIPELISALEELTPGKTETDSDVEQVDDGMRESISGYLTIKITDSENSMEIFDKLYSMPGIQSCDAVRGDFDVVLLAQAESAEGIEEVFNAVKAIDGIQVLSMSQVERPKLDRDVDQFIDTYQKAVKQEAQAGARRQPGSMSYIIVDIDPDSIQQIFTTVFFIDEVVVCDVIEDGTKLVGMITGHGAVGKTPRIIEKLSQIDGVLRVREAKVIKLLDD
ncbi:MAG: response regulator [Candidatus Fermentibacteria bacterium]|nr:response regulator [Candidatus Fermentibacteria bacterium]